MEPKLIKGGISVDDRGQLSFINEFPEGIKRFYTVENHRKGLVRAWHGHEREQKYVVAVKGAALVKLVAFDGAEKHPSASTMPPWGREYVLSDRDPTMLYIPGRYYNGFMTLTDDAQLLFFSTATLEESINDDIRIPADKWGKWVIKER